MLSELKTKSGREGKKEILQRYIYFEEHTWTEYSALLVNLTAAMPVELGSSSLRGAILYVLGGFCESLLNSMEHFMPGDEQWYTDVAMTTKCIHFSTVTKLIRQ